jgi:hypothetical protein
VRTDPLLSGDTVNSGRCYVTLATFLHETIDELYFLFGLCRDVTSKGQSQLRVSSVWESLKIELEPEAGE